MRSPGAFVSRVAYLCGASEATNSSKSWIVPQRIPARIDLQISVSQIARDLHELTHQLERLVGFAGPGVNLRQPLQHEHAVVGIAAQRHQLDRAPSFRDRLFLLPEAGVHLRKDGNRARVVGLDRQALLQNFTGRGKGSTGFLLIAGRARDDRLVPGAWIIEAEIDFLKGVAR